LIQPACDQIPSAEIRALERVFRARVTTAATKEGDAHRCC
jgi:hypothetical protein